MVCPGTGCPAQGSGIFAPAGNVLAFTTNDVERLRIDSSGNVGIGTTSPGAKLHVYDVSSDIEGKIETDGAGKFARLILSNPEREMLMTNNAVDDLFTIFYGGANRLQFNTTDQWFNAGNVGIGTTSPAYALDVVGSIRASGTVMGSFSGSINAANVSSGQFGANVGNGNFSFPANVGIGTTSPGAPLHVAGTPSNQNGFDGYVQAGQLQLGVDESGSPQPMIIPSSSGQDLHFGTLVGGVANKRLTILSGGNVGIGTTSPASLLHMEGASPVLTIKQNDTSSGAVEF